VARGIDNIKKARGECTTTMQALRMKSGNNPAVPGAQPLAILKFK
jgi:hypothetical protein